LKAPKGQATRPTADRVREALFSILSARLDIEGAAVLDVFAGTGALGLEALSRGAREVTFVEHAKPALSALRENIASLDVEKQSTVLAKRADAAVASLSRVRFDLVLCDPPWADLPALKGLFVGLGRLLRENGVFVLEHAARMAAAPIEGLHVVDARRYGDTSITFFQP
jgi:16S rRNA (guanine966-N2)-methyltransferase